MRSIGKRGIKKLVVFSMDVCKMFPSMVAADVARVVREEYKSARLEVEVDDNELSLALAILVSHTLIKPCSDFVVVVLM